MGYRSDVVIAIEFEGREDLVSFVAFMRMNTKPAVQDVLNDMVSIPETNIIALIIEGVKWYDTYEYTQAAEHIHEIARDREASTMRMIVGEEYNDITYDVHSGVGYSTLDQHFDVVRYIKFPSDTAPMLKSLTTTVE